MNVRHNIVSPFLLLLRSKVELCYIKILLAGGTVSRLETRCYQDACSYEVLLHLSDGLIGDGQPQFLLGDRKVQPELSPGMGAHLNDQDCL